MRTKNNYFEIRHNGYVLLFLVAVLFSFVIILEIIDFVEHSFKANWFMYIGLLVFCVLLSFPVLFTTLKIKVRKDEIMVVKTCGIRIKITTDEIKKVTIIKPDIEKSWLKEKEDNACEWCKEPWKEILITVTIVIGAVLAIAMVTSVSKLANFGTSNPLLINIPRTFEFTSGLSGLFSLNGSIINWLKEK